MKPPSPLPPVVTPSDLEEDPPELKAAMARGLADMKAGRVVSHAEVKAWLMKLARGERAPRPKPRKSLG